MSARPAMVLPHGTVRPLRSAAAPLGLGTTASATPAALGTTALPSLGLGTASSAATRVGTALVTTARWSCALQDEKGPRR